MRYKKLMLLVVAMVSVVQSCCGMEIDSGTRGVMQVYGLGEDEAKKVATVLAQSPDYFDSFPFSKREAVLKFGELLDKGLLTPRGARFKLRIFQAQQLLNLEKIENHDRKNQICEIAKHDIFLQGFWNALEKGKFDLVQDTVEKDGVEFWSKIFNTNNLLCEVCTWFSMEMHDADPYLNNQSKILEYLVSQKKLDANKPDDRGMTPLFCACKGYCMKLPKLLIERCGARIDLSCKQMAQKNTKNCPGLYPYLLQELPKQNLYDALKNPKSFQDCRIVLKKK